jgi:hypothetical protein
LYGFDEENEERELIRAAHAVQRSKRQDLPLTPLRCVRGWDENATSRCGKSITR